MFPVRSVVLAVVGTRLPAGTAAETDTNDTCSSDLERARHKLLNTLESYPNPRETVGEKTGIEWTSATWNPWRGCTRVSPGCAKCYMFREQERYGRDPTVVTRCKPGTFNAPLKWQKAGEARLVFTCSWSDFFHQDADEWRAEAWNVIRQTPALTYQILTKRPERIWDALPANWFPHGYPNVWLGTSVETEKYVDRIKPLIEVPAIVHFVSAEPLLGSLGKGWADGVDWVIVGGESGPGARPMELEWAREIREVCKANGVAFFLKQLGGYPNARSHEKAVLDGERWIQMPR